MQALFARLKDDRRGATAIEYGLIVGLISGAIILAAGTIGTEIATAFEGIATALETELAD